MRVLFTTWAAPGHLFPMIPLAWAFQAAGHEVRIAGPPSCQAAVVRAGLCAVSVGDQAALAAVPRPPELAAWGRPARWPRGWSAHLDLLDPDRRRVIRALYEKQCAVAELMLGDLIAFGRWWRPDLVVHDVLAMAGPVLAAVLKVPAVGHGWEVGSTLHPPTGDRDAEPLPAYRELFERYADEVTDPVGWVDPCPPSVRPPDGPPVRRLPVRCVPYNGSGRHPGWLHERGRPRRVCVTAGVAGARYRDPGGPDVLTLTLRSLAATNAEIVLAPAGPVDEEELPANVRIARDVPFRMLLPTCDLVVHHGGAGTALTAAVLGVPQLVVPPSPICTEIGHGIVRAGAGAMLDRLDSSELLLKTATDMLEAPDAYREAAGRVRSETAGLPSPSALADELAQW
ncbi:nucleotide disphospho-sugar-binding domain-containing protein [Streptomyces aurantiacus]|uniref:nucleotide disphospho-sugar-binding domain-containing protein n=1 Tax=Streptomyces aurantiacus TaxID=47760 RepID=UPI0006E15C67|nr:nucleotide disphospho-sugar-binding domain-containing protein [Streptomyces aurantiacus]